MRVRDFKIGTKIALAFLLYGLLVPLIGGNIVYYTSRNLLKRQIYDHLGTTAQSRARHVDAFLEEQKSKIKIAATHADLTVEELKELRDINKGFYEVFVLDSKGKIIASSDGSQIGIDKSSDAYFISGKEGTFIKDVYFSETTKKNSITVSAPFHGGVLVARIETVVINEIASGRAGLGETGEIYLINKDFLMITPSRFTKDVFLKQKVDTENARNVFNMSKGQAKHAGYKTVGVFPDYRGVSVLGAHAYIPEMDWGLLAEIDEKEALLPLQQLRKTMFFIMFMIPVLAGLIGWYFSRIITKPIIRLRDVAVEMGKGNLDVKVVVESKDEIGDLSEVFNRMTTNLKTTTISREWFSTTLKSIGDAVISSDTKGNVTFMNPVAEDLTGWRQEEASGRSMNEVFNIINEGTREKGENIVEKAVRTGKIIGLANHTILIAKDKTERAIADSASPIHNRDNKIVGVVLVFRDVSESRKVQKELDNKLHDLEMFNNVAVGRELKMVELKEEIARLKEKLGRKDV